MYFLSHIDSIYREERKKYNIPLDNYIFRTYVPIKFMAASSPLSFSIQKSKLAKLLIVDGKQRVYLSDNDIMNTILKMKDSDIQWFIKQFVELYQSQGVPFEFLIEDVKYSYLGIKNYPSTESIHLFSDTTIQIQDLVLVLNFIFAKDYCWEHMPIPTNTLRKPKSRKDFSKRTLCKYITLIDYYAWKTPRSLNFLKLIGYPTENKTLKEVHREENFFQHTELFDISHYL